MPRHCALYDNFFRTPPKDLAEYPTWMILFFYKIVLPMLGLTAIAMKIILKNGKDLQRELIGTKINQQMGWTHTDLDQISNVYSIAAT